MLLDGREYDTFVIDCATSVETLRIKNISPGKLYVFVVVQSASGNHRFNWGDRIRNGVAVDLSPNGMTVQSFVGLTGGILQAVPPGTWLNATSSGTPGPPGQPGPPGPPGPPAQIIQVANEAAAITASANDPANFYFWV